MKRQLLNLLCSSFSYEGNPESGMVRRIQELAFLRSFVSTCMYVSLHVKEICFFHMCYFE